MYRPPTQGRQGSFTETITKHFSKNNTNDAEMYILADFNIDLFSNQKYPYFIKRILNQCHTKLTISNNVLSMALNN